MEFILLGLNNSPELQMHLFWLFTFIYVLALTCNILLIICIRTYKKLHNPMYFLVINLSLVNLFSITVTTPKLLQTLWTDRKTISFSGCISQMFLFIWALGTELLLLSFSCYTVCHPLKYTMIIRKEECVGIATGVWLPE